MAPTFAAIGITVADLNASLEFYGLLGLDFPLPDGGGHVECTGPGGVRIMLDTVAEIHSFNPDWRPPVGGPAMSLAFECTDAAEVDAAVARIARAGFTVQREPWDAFWGQRYATVADPDGNHVDVFAWT
ncbi:MAG: VOC family protein [Propionibacteriaceae bacterium]|nr:VOC family protein [Propionibacteriaceae bacterium]